MDNLPSELLDLIVGHISRRYYYECSLINKRFYAVITPLLWRYINIPNRAFFNTLMTNTLLLHPYLGQHIERAHFSSLHTDLLMFMQHRPPGDYQRFLTDTSLTTFIKHTPYLKQLVIGNGTNLTDMGFQNLAYDCPGLESFHVFGAHITQLTVDVIGKLTRLRHVGLENCIGLDHRVFPSLTTCPNFTDLTISGCDLEGMDDKDTAKAALLAMARLDYMLTLTLREDPYDVGQCLTTCLNAWPYLTELWLHDCPHITDAQVVDFIKVHPHLKSLVLFGGSLTDETLEAVGTYLPGIVVLGTLFNWGMTEFGVRRLVKRCKALGEFKLFGSGILAVEFPEAGEHCWEEEDQDYEDEDDDAPVFLEYLDVDAIREIQRNSNDSDNDDNANNDGDN